MMAWTLDIDRWRPPPPLGPSPEMLALAHARAVLHGTEWPALAAQATTWRAQRIARAAAELVAAIDEGDYPWREVLAS